MIISYLHQGSGGGNQLFRMVAARIKALELGTDWGMIWNPDNSGKPVGFKCQDFMEFDYSKVVARGPNFSDWLEKKVVEDGVDIRPYDPEWNFIQDNTVIEGELQSEVYFQDYEKEVNEWLKVEPLEVPDDTCVISHRGGEFTLYPDLYLPKKYWDYAISKMRAINPNMKFQVQTDDVVAAKIMFPDFEIIHDIGYNWRAIRFAKYLIVGNSSFSILPSWLGKAHLILAPKYHARHNTRVWSMTQNFYKKYTYIDPNDYQ